jgi:hypothetical protein
MKILKIRLNSEDGWRKLALTDSLLGYIDAGDRAEHVSSRSPTGVSRADPDKRYTIGHLRLKA